jgi:hypothetical protein
MAGGFHEGEVHGFHVLRVLAVGTPGVMRAVAPPAPAGVAGDAVGAAAAVELDREVIEAGATNSTR